MPLEFLSPPRALTAWRDTVRQAPQDSGAWQGLAMAYEAQGHFLQALDAYRRAAQLGASQGQVELALGLLFLGRGFLGQAETAFRAAAADRAHAADAYFNLGIVLLRRERYTEAHAAFETFLAERSDPAGHAYDGLALLSLHRPAEAVAAFARAHSCDPAYVAARTDVLDAWGAALDALADTLAPASPAN